MGSLGYEVEKKENYTATQLPQGVPRVDGSRGKYDVGTGDMHISVVLVHPLNLMAIESH
jgi:hypothetical protein